MQQHAARPAHGADLRNRLDGADFVVRQHHADQDRFVAQRGGNLVGCDQSGPWAVGLFDRQQCDLAA